VRSPKIDFSKVEIRTTRVSDNFFVLEGQGGAISLLTGSDGVLMIDSEFAPLTDKIIAAIQHIADQPVRYLVNTHVHADHTGGNENLAKRGVLIFSREQVRSRLAEPSPDAYGRTRSPAGEIIALCGPNTKVVPGHGPIVDRSAVVAQRDLILATRDRMMPLIAKGMTFDQVLQANLTADSGVPVPAGAETAEQFIWWLYVELTESPTGLQLNR